MRFTPDCNISVGGLEQHRTSGLSYCSRDAAGMGIAWSGQCGDECHATDRPDALHGNRDDHPGAASRATEIAQGNQAQFLSSMRVSFAIFAVLCFGGIFASPARGPRDTELSTERSQLLAGQKTSNKLHPFIHNTARLPGHRLPPVEGIEPPTRLGAQGLRPCCAEIVTDFLLPPTLILLCWSADLKTSRRFVGRRRPEGLAASHCLARCLWAPQRT